MTTAQTRNILWYLIIAVGAAILATGLQLGAVLSTDDPILWRPLTATFVTTLFGTLATAAGTAFRPKAGREDISALVAEVGRDQATTVLEVEAIRQQTGANAPLSRLSDEDVDRLARRGLEVMREADEERVRDVPAFLRKARSES
jgi:hypothetical protein